MTINQKEDDQQGDNRQLPVDRCRLVLVVPPFENAEIALKSALEGGDVASVFLPRGEMEDAAYQKHATVLTKIAQEVGAVSLIPEDSQIMGRSGADGIFLNGEQNDLKQAIERFAPKHIIGYGKVRTRHSAMEVGEISPDFIFLGKLDGDIKPEPHPKNVKLAEWCAEVMQIPIVVMGGTSVEGVVEVAKSGADFVALGLAVFSPDFSNTDAPKQAVAKANMLLDNHAPRFEDE